MINDFHYMALQVRQMRAALSAIHKAIVDEPYTSEHNKLVHIIRVSKDLDAAFDHLKPLQVESIKTVGHTVAEQEEHVRSQIV